jgi:hypothetical protein
MLVFVLPLGMAGGAVMARGMCPGLDFLQCLPVGFPQRSAKFERLPNHPFRFAIMSLFSQYLRQIVIGGCGIRMMFHCASEGLFSTREISQRVTRIA